MLNTWITDSGLISSFLSDFSRIHMIGEAFWVQLHTLLLAHVFAFSLLQFTCSFDCLIPWIYGGRDFIMGDFCNDFALICRVQWQYFRTDDSILGHILFADYFLQITNSALKCKEGYTFFKNFIGDEKCLSVIQDLFITLKKSEISN